MTGQEDIAKQYLEKMYNDQQRFIVPKRRLKERKAGVWHEVLRTLYPGYVLVQGEMTARDIYIVRSAPGAIRLISDNNEPLKIAENEINVIRSLIGDNGIIEYSDAIVQGKKIIITDGPLVSREGIVHSINRRKGRAKVKLQMFNEERLVEVGINILLPSG